MARIGSFDPTLRPEGWFDETGVPEGFFDEDLIGVEEEVEVEIPSNAGSISGYAPQITGGGGAGSGNYDQSDEETILAVIQAFMSCQ